MILESVARTSAKIPLRLLCRLLECPCGRCARLVEIRHELCYISSRRCRAIRDNKVPRSVRVFIARAARSADFGVAAEAPRRYAPVYSCCPRRASGATGAKHWPRNFRAARRPILFDDSEAAKRLSTVEAIARALVRAGADRHSVLVAVGGGVVGDVAGFAAATYLRGVRLVHIPTTLVAQVDSSIGGKTGVNLPEGKNLVGAFYPPKLVIADPNLLRTLPHREFRSGLYEVVKYGVIADARAFRISRKAHAGGAAARPWQRSRWIIPRCAAIKAHVVSEDEREGGLRQILNFGHTIGHALEAVTGYRRFPARRSDRLGNDRRHAAGGGHGASARGAMRCASFG